MNSVRRSFSLLAVASAAALMVAGPASLASGAGSIEGDGGEGLPDWTSLVAPTYLNFRKASIYGGSNEVQRQIISRTILGL